MRSEGGAVVCCRLPVKAVEAGKSVESGESGGLVYRVSCIVYRLSLSV